MIEYLQQAGISVRISNKWAICALSTTLAVTLSILSPNTLAKAERLDCEKIFAPATKASFPFTWRDDRCEGLIKKDISYNRKSVKISSFGFGRLAGEGPFKISNRSDKKIELSGSLLSRNTFYRLIAHLSPAETITWQYPAGLTKIYGLNIARLRQLIGL